MSEDSELINHLSSTDIFEIHELIVESNADTEAGVISPGDVEYIVEYVREGYFGQKPESIHEKAFHLLRLISANHPFTDGNKRTALMSVRIFYALNGVRLDYDRTIKEILKEFATDERAVDERTVRSYLRDHSEPLADEYQATVRLCLSRINGTEDLPSDDHIGSFDEE